MSNNAICNYDFRANEENFTVESLKAIIDPICDKWTFQLEEGEESGYRHWLFQLWSAIETVKDGYCFDTRYSFKETYFDPPRFIIFTNKCPDMDMLSGDRWKLWQITDSLELEAYQPPKEFEGRPSIEEAF